MKKAIYRLRQSGRTWYKDIDAMFICEGFLTSHAHHSLYIKQTSEYLLIVIIYVDGLIMLACNMAKMEALKATLKEEYNMSNLGELYFCLEIKFVKDHAAHTITMSQKKYLEEVLEWFVMQDCKSVDMLLDTNAKLMKLG